MGKSCISPVRTIPTCVGTTRDAESPGRNYPDHPHVRGDNFLKRAVSTGTSGPSPRAWGQHRARRMSFEQARTIPTCVGTTDGSAMFCGVPPDHPHVRGDNCGAKGSGKSQGGPSPRAWGQRLHHLPRHLSERTIPTCVGTTAAQREAEKVKADHPHVRGDNKHRARHRT